MSWLPSLRVMPATLCGDDGEHEGFMLELRWGRWSAELTVARRLPEIGL